MGAAISRPGRLVAGRVERPLLSVGDGGEAVPGHSQAHQVIPSGPRALLAEGEVVVGGAALVAMPLDRDLGRAMVLQPEGVFLEEAAGLVAQPRLVVLEEDVGQRAALARG